MLPESRSRTVSDVIKGWCIPQVVRQLSAPPYEPGKVTGERYGLCCPSMADHTTNEGWQLFRGLRYNGYQLFGHGIDGGWCTDVREIAGHDPDVLLLQDKREWDKALPGFKNKEEHFYNVKCLESRHDIFKLTVLKDAHQKPEYHRQSALEMRCHAWVTYYHPDIVKHLAPYVRKEHLVRTYHTLNPKMVPPYSTEDRSGCVLSGAVSRAYPLRLKLFSNAHDLHDTTVLPHPGYHAYGTHTNEYLTVLSRYKVSICTSSVFGYALRKIMESTACGCRVVTDLPEDEVLPGIDGNLYRVPPDATIAHVNAVIDHLTGTYDPELQRDYATKAKAVYDYRAVTGRLVKDIEGMRQNYNERLR